MFIKLRARFYNPVIGRFTQEDTYREDGLNLYAYCGNNPVMYYDPSGYQGEVFGQCTMGDQAGNEKQMTPDDSGSTNEVPNPNGKKDGKEHQDTIASIDPMKTEGEQKVKWITK